jgi:hypothetical protein
VSFQQYCFSLGVHDEVQIQKSCSPKTEAIMFNVLFGLKCVFIQCNPRYETNIKCVIHSTLLFFFFGNPPSSAGIKRRSDKIDFSNELLLGILRQQKVNMSYQCICSLTFDIQIKVFAKFPNGFWFDISTIFLITCFDKQNGSIKSIQCCQPDPAIGRERERENN